MDSREIGRIFHRDGYRLAAGRLAGGIREEGLKDAIRMLYDAVEELLVSFVKRSALEGRPAACKKGCSWCCHQAVFAVTHEWLYLGDHVRRNCGKRQQDTFIARAREKSLLTRDRSLEDQLKVRAPCPFLDRDACAVYPARPMACRIYLSSSADSCKREHWEPGNPKSIPDLFEFPLRAGRMLNEGFVACLKQNGLPSLELTLEQGYASMVSQGQTLASWIGRE
jgi:Fe-S-cluster containining protein